MKKLNKKVISMLFIIVIIAFIMPITVFAATRPSVSVSRPSTTSVNVGGTVSYTVSYTGADDIYLSESYVNLNGFTANVNVSGSGNTRTITLSNIQGTAGSGKTISIRSGSAENENGSSLATPNSFSFTLNAVSNPPVVNPPVTNDTDSLRPSVSISSPSVSSVNVGGAVTYTVSVTDNVGVTTNNLSSSINLNGFTANISVSGSGSSKTVTLSNIQGAAGSKNISIKAGAFGDAAGNMSLQTPNSFSFTLNTVSNPPVDNPPVTNSSDKVRPSISISRPSVTSVKLGGTVTYTVSFNDNVGVTNVNLSSDYITLNGFTADVSVTGSGSTRLITLSNIQGEIGGNKTVIIKARAVEDAAGNGSLATPKSFSFSITKQDSAGPSDEVTPPKDTPKDPGKKMDDEPYTGVKSLPLLPIMGSVAGVLTIAGVVVTKKIYG